MSKTDGFIQSKERGQAVSDLLDERRDKELLEAKNKEATPPFKAWRRPAKKEIDSEVLAKINKPTRRW
ncbi:MAG: hypothetical protein KJ737_07125 [Proteobacteria bacterium]|nr:hypothetical protein [Pseudomonadota bacterium]